MSNKVTQIKTAGPAEARQDIIAAPDTAQERPARIKSIITFRELQERVPYGSRTLREHIRKNHIPRIALPGATKWLFHWPSVESALLRMQVGGNWD